MAQSSELPIETGAETVPPRVMLAVGPRIESCMLEHLHQLGVSVVTLAESARVPAEVIIREQTGVAASQFAEKIDSADRPGVVMIGEENGAADVSLHADFTRRELGIAIRLLAQVVRLRRQLHEGAQQGHAWRREAACDALTQLPNRRAWDEELSQRLLAASGSAQSLCVALVDLDHFKQVNDGWGHAAGDQLLIAAAAALRQSLRQDDFVARLGGDEFGLILAGLDAASAPGVVERVRADLPARIARVTPFVTSASVGYCVFDGASDTTPEKLLAQADRARRLAKTQGRDRAMLA
jgi:diguanylate cyclase (GGDEF)-like protein